tara:strand:- start:228 stop:875 length:648 start_codon:yes stop_codon:yes gene_type:complete
VEFVNNILANNIGIYAAAILAVLSGLSIRLALSIVKQKWASTYHHTMSYTLLPLITLVITKVISGNIALSLGMVGALSIVRFRNPVKNSFELVIFFALITIGISMGVNPKYALLLTIIINMLIILSFLTDFIGRKFNLHIFSASFDEGNTNNIIEIHASKDIHDLENSKFLVQHVITEHEVLYRLLVRSRIDVHNLKEKIKNNNNIISIDITLSQ